MTKEPSVPAGMIRLERALRFCMEGWGAKAAAFKK